MPSRREIREAVVQFLYCADLEGGADPSALRGAFWDFVTECDRRSLLLATFRTIHHLAQGRSERIAEFVQRQEAAVTFLSAWPEAESLKSGITRIAKLESQWSASLAQLERLPKDGDDATIVDRFTKPLDAFFTIDRAVAEARQIFFKGMDDFPALHGRLESVAASIRRLQRISDRLRMVEEPERFPEQADLGSLRDSKSHIHELRVSTDLLVDEIIANKQIIDSSLAELVENYSPERIDPVDRAILRLAAQEILKAETPMKVVLNEAIELAKRYGTTDSQRFVNGILDRFAKVHAKNGNEA